MNANAYTEGLNYLPFLAQPTPPSSGRTRLSSGSSRRSSTMSFPLPQPTIICYNGNYEGDCSMFGLSNKIASSHMDLIETDSEIDYQKEFSNYQGVSVDADTPDSQLWRLVNQCKGNVMSAERLAQVSTFTEQLQNNFYYQKFCEVLGLAITLLVWLLRLCLFILVRFANWSYGLWKSRSMLRSTSRRLLWWMTLSKYEDLSLFGLILIVTPLLFAMALIGFMLSVYCAFKEWLSRYGYILRNHIL